MNTANLTLSEIVEGLDREAKALRTKLEAVEHKKKMAIELLNGDQYLLQVSSTAKTGKSTGLTQAVLNVMGRLAKDRALSSADVTNELLSQDFQPRGKQFSTSVYTTLVRLTEDKLGRVRGITHADGKRTFMFRNGHE